MQVAPVMIRKLDAGESSTARAFDSLLRPHMPALYRYAWRWTTNRERAEDLVQELLLRLFPRTEELLQLDLVLPWAVRVMYRIFIDQHRRANNSPVKSESELFGNGHDLYQTGMAGLPDPAPEPPELAERHLLRTRLQLAWQKLSGPHRVVLTLHDIEGYSLPELANIFEVPTGTMKSRLHRARAHLRGLLAAESNVIAIRFKEPG